MSSASGSSMVGTKGKRVGHPQWNKAKRSQAGTGEVVVKFVLEPFKLKSSLWGTHKSARSTTSIYLIKIAQTLQGQVYRSGFQRR